MIARLRLHRARPTLLLPTRLGSILLPCTSSKLLSLGRTYAAKARKPVLPEFDYRRSFQGEPLPTTEYVRDHDEADDYLEAFRSKRLSVVVEKQPNDFYIAGEPYTNSKGDIAILAIADQEGIVALHLSEMKRTPSLLKGFLEDPSIIKQGCGAANYSSFFMQESARFDAKVEGFLELRLLAKSMVPALNDIGNSIVNDTFNSLMCEVILGHRLAHGGRNQLEGVNLLRSHTLDEIYNRAWSHHILGRCLHEGLREVDGKRWTTEDQARLMEMFTYSWRDYNPKDRE